VKRLTPFHFRTKDGKIVKPNWRSHTATVFVFLHDGNCIACKNLCRKFAEWSGRFAEWDADLWLVWRGDFIPEGCEGFLETNSKTRKSWLDGEASGVLIVDRDGIVACKWETSTMGFPTPEEVLATVKQIALQCPE